MVTSIYKGKFKLEVSNYRPVSVLPIISKVLEKLKFNIVAKFLEESEVIKKVKKKTRENFTVKMMEQIIKEKDYSWYLGIVVGKNFSWSHHIKHVNLKISQVIATL